MERLDALIKRLAEQHAANAPQQSLLATATMIVAELQQQENENAPSQVSVMMPAVMLNNAQAIGEIIIKEEKKTEPVVQKQEEENVVSKFYLDPFKEFPTLALKQQEMRELKENFSDGESLNDKLKTEQTEVASKLTETPVKDLRKAIGINDRYLFLSELFRGDEAMYERSIKTINTFNIYGEAEFWINRELKTKLGWNEESATVKDFFQLVRRRFS